MNIRYHYRHYRGRGGIEHEKYAYLSKNKIDANRLISVLEELQVKRITQRIPSSEGYRLLSSVEKYF
jgi:hypothetical protein